MATRRNRSRLAVAASLPWAAWAVLRLTGGERGFPLVPALAFTPYAAGSAVLPLVNGVRAGSPAAALVSAGAGAALGAAVLGRARRPPAPRTGPAGATLRVATVSLRLGLASADAVVELVRRCAVDVLAVAELTPEALGRLRAAGLEELLPHACVLPARAGSVESASGAVWSRGAAAPRPPVPGTFEQPTVRLAGAGVPVEVTAVHSAPPATGPRSVRAWADDLAALPAPAPEVLRVLAGDFNATHDHAAFRRVLATGYLDAAQAAGRGLAWTWRPLRLPVPRLALDHVLVDPRLRVAAHRLVPVAGSDHRALTVDLVLPGPRR